MCLVRAHASDATGGGPTGAEDWSGQEGISGTSRAIEAEASWLAGKERRAL
jgi:hypothetical protein